VWRTCFERDCGPDTKQTKHNDDDDDVRKRDLPSFTHYPNTWTEGLRRTTKTPRIVQIQLSPLLNTILRFANIPPSYHAKKIICPFKPISKYGYCLNSRISSCCQWNTFVLHDFYNRSLLFSKQH
jgi:hypothetical protein